MFLQPYTVILILILTMALFIWGRWRYDIVALIALMACALLGVVPYKQVYSGLSNNAVITVACVMVISQAISRSGILNYLVRKIRLVSHYPTLHITLMSFVTGFLSAFMNNVGALALMMPVAIQSMIESKRSPSLILMPIAIASALGGLITVIGTPPNLLISSYRQNALGQPFSMFDFSYVGVPLAIVGILFLGILGWRLMPGQRSRPSSAEDIFQIQDYITEIQVPKNSPIVGMSVTELEAKVKKNFLTLGYIRQRKKHYVIPAHHTFEANDILIVEGSPQDITELLEVGKLKLETEEKKFSAELLKTDTIHLIEAVVPQGSRLEGRSSQALRLRSRAGINLLAISREGKPFKERLTQVKLQAGDVVLLQGARETLRVNAAEQGFLPLEERELTMGKQPKAYLPLLIFIGAIFTASIGLLPVQIAFGGAVLLMMLLNVIPLKVVYESIDWPIIILLAAMIPIGDALQSTGGTGMIAHYFISLSSHVSTPFVLVLLLIVTMTLSDFMNNAATAVVMGPIAVSIAQALHANIDPFLMIVAIGASCSFLTPVGHQNNTLVMGPGGYKFTDFIRLGFPVEILVLIMSVPLVLWVWPIFPNV